MPRKQPTIVFVSDLTPGTEPDSCTASSYSRTASIKKFHRKSRTGCENCKSRRVKCDESTPQCGNCMRRNESCQFTTVSIAPSKVSKQAHQGPARGNDLEHDRASLGESRSRRLQEMQLLHTYMTHTGPSTSFDRDGPMYDYWVSAIPRMALRSEALLYAVFATVSLHHAISDEGTEATDLARYKSPSAATTTTTTTSSRQTHRSYLNLALLHHSDELRNQDPANADNLTAMAGLLRVMAFALLSDRELTPYKPPLDWLRLVFSHVQAFSVAHTLVGHVSNSQTARLFGFTPRPGDKKTRSTSRLTHLLLADGSDFDDETRGDHADLWDAATRKAYETTAEYLEDIVESMINREPIGTLGRRLVLFPLFVQSIFVDLVADMRPRALAILLHYFALLHSIRSFWFVGHGAQREAQALLDHMHWHSQSEMDRSLRCLSRICEEYTQGVGLVAGETAGDVT